MLQRPRKHAGCLEPRVRMAAMPARINIRNDKPRGALAAPMTDRTIIAAASPIPRDRNGWFPRLDAGLGGLWLLIAVGALIVMPPFFYLVSSSVTVPLPGFRSMVGLDNYRRVIEISGWQLWGAT